MHVITDNIRNSTAPLVDENRKTGEYFETQEKIGKIAAVNGMNASKSARMPC